MSMNFINSCVKSEMKSCGLSLKSIFVGFLHHSFQLYVKLFVLMSSSWIIGLVIWQFNVEYDGSSGFYRRNTILLILHWGIDLLGSSFFILVVFGFSQTIRSKLEKNYTMFSGEFYSMLFLCISLI